MHSRVLLATVMLVACAGPAAPRAPLALRLTVPTQVEPPRSAEVSPPAPSPSVDASVPEPAREAIVPEGRPVCNTPMSDQALCMCLSPGSTTEAPPECMREPLAMPGFELVHAPGGDLYVSARSGEGTYVVDLLEESGMGAMHVTVGRLEHAGKLPVLWFEGVSETSCEDGGNVTEGRIEWVVLCPVRGPGTPLGACQRIQTYSYQYEKEPGQPPVVKRSRLVVRLTHKGEYVVTADGPVGPEDKDRLGRHAL